jgi:hypothetical protein
MGETQQTRSHAAKTSKVTELPPDWLLHRTHSIQESEQPGPTWAHVHL